MLAGAVMLVGAVVLAGAVTLAGMAARPRRGSDMHRR
jgi:hypothetical protein